MARKVQPNAEVQRLILLSEISRASLETEAGKLKHRLDFPSRIRESLKHSPGTWVLGSLVAGLGASLFFRRSRAKPRKSEPEPQSHPVARKTIPLTLLGLALTSIRPVANAWLVNQLKTLAARRFYAAPRSTTQPPPAPPFQPI